MLMASALLLFIYVSAFLRGCGGTVIFRLRNISVATERCDVFLAEKGFPRNLFST